MSAGQAMIFFIFTRGASEGAGSAIRFGDCDFKEIIFANTVIFGNIFFFSSLSVAAFRAGIRIGAFRAFGWTFHTQKMFVFIVSIEALATFEIRVRPVDAFRALIGCA